MFFFFFLSCFRFPFSVFFIFASLFLSVSFHSFCLLHCFLFSFPSACRDSFRAFVRIFFRVVIIVSVFVVFVVVCCFAFILVFVPPLFVSFVLLFLLSFFISLFVPSFLSVVLSFFLSCFLSFCFPSVLLRSFDFPFPVLFLSLVRCLLCLSFLWCMCSCCLLSFFLSVLYVLVSHLISFFCSFVFRSAFLYLSLFLVFAV